MATLNWVCLVTPVFLALASNATGLGGASQPESMPTVIRNRRSKGVVSRAYEGESCFEQDPIDLLH